MGWQGQGGGGTACWPPPSWATARTGCVERSRRWN